MGISQCQLQALGSERQVSSCSVKQLLGANRQGDEAGRVHATRVQAARMQAPRWRTTPRTRVPACWRLPMERA